MSVSITEHDNSAHLATLLDFIKASSETWGLVVVKRNYVRPMTSEAFTLTIEPALEGASQAHIYFLNDKTIYIAWCGKQKTVYNKLRNSIGIVLLQPGLHVDPAVVVGYLDPVLHADNIKDSIATLQPAPETAKDAGFPKSGPSDSDDEDEDDSAPSTLKASNEQRSVYMENIKQKAMRQQLHFLVVEDQIFSQKLICEILRGVRVRNNNETPAIDTAQGIQDAWKIFLKKVPDIVFVDLNLIDGSGHTLARAIKEVDPSCHVIIVTANDFEEEMSVARQNNVDNFIAKPYNKKQIFDCINKYIEVYKSQGKTGRSGYIR